MRMRAEHSRLTHLLDDATSDQTQVSQQADRPNKPAMQFFVLFGGLVGQRDRLQCHKAMEMNTFHPSQAVKESQAHTPTGASTSYSGPG